MSVTGLEYSYSSSPESMKAFVLALYLLTTSIGDLLGGVLYSSVFATLNRAITLHLCAFIMLLNFFCFIGVARFGTRTRLFKKMKMKAMQMGLQQVNGLIEMNLAHQEPKLN